MDVLEHNKFMAKILMFFDGLTAMFIPFLYLYYDSLGFSQTQIGIIAATIFASAILTEVSSGIFSDLYGRKKAVLISKLSFIVFISILLLSSSFLVLLFGAIFLGLTKSFHSGSFNALVYDSFKDAKKEKQFKSFYSQLYFIVIGVGGVSILLAGLLFGDNILRIFQLSLLFETVSILAVVSLKEPTLYTKESMTHKKLFTSGIKSIRSSEKLLYIILFSTLIGGTINALYRYHSLYLAEISFTVEMISFIYAAFYFISAFLGRISPWVEKKIGIKISLYLIPFLVGLTYSILGTFPIAVIGFLLLIEGASVGFSHVLVADLKHKEIKSSERATVDSMASFSQNIVKVVVSLFVGFGANYLGIVSIYLLLGIIMLVFGYVISRKLTRLIS